MNRVSFAITVPRVQDLLDKATKLEARTQKRRRLKTDGGHEEEAEEGEDNVGAQDDDTQEYQVATPRATRGNTSGVESETRTSKKRPADRLDLKLPLVYEVDTNPHKVGCAEYWIHELSIQAAFDGSKLGKPV